MDSVRFDHLARNVARHDRRQLLGVVLAIIGLAAPSSTRSQQAGFVVLGGTCTVDADCQHGGPYGMCPARDPICGDNGFISDGPLTCCTDGCCSSDADCCGELRCIAQYEVGSRCMSVSKSARFPGQLCVTNADCFYWPGCEAECVDQRCTCSGQWTDLHPDTEDRPLIADNEAAMQAAELIAGLELQGDVGLLYRSLHPDAQALIPADAVIGWYRNEFLHFGEPPPRAIKMRVTPWTWEVTGKTYPETAEVVTKQVLEDGTVVWDEVRLVKDHNGNWCWFFGRTDSFVAEQVDRFVREDPDDHGAFLGKPCSRTLDCSQTQSPAQCVDAMREGIRQQVCLNGPTGYCQIDEDCHQEDGKTICVGDGRRGSHINMCLRTEGATCKSNWECLASLTCRIGTCTKAS